MNTAYQNYSENQENQITEIIDPNRVRYWGPGQRAHNDFAGCDMVAAGSFFPPGHTWQSGWQADRIAALSAGADPDDWPLQPDGMTLEENVFCREGTHVGASKVKSYLPLPSEPHIRKWILDLSTAESVQAWGRARGANLPDRPATIRHFGGVPLVGLEQYGLQVDHYETDPIELGRDREAYHTDRRLDALGRVAFVLKDLPEGAGRPQINRALAVLGWPGVHGNTWKNIRDMLPGLTLTPERADQICDALFDLQEVGTRVARTREGLQTWLRAIIEDARNPDTDRAAAVILMDSLDAVIAANDAPQPAHAQAP